MSKIQIPTNYDERVRLAADDLVTGEDANKHLAMLTHETTLTGKKLQPDRVTMEQWTADIRQATGRRFSRATGFRYKAVWAKYGDSLMHETVSWSDAFYEVQGITQEESFAPFANQDARRVIKDLEHVAPEVKQALAAELMNDPDTAERIERRFIDKAAQDPTLTGRINMAYQEFHPTPTPAETPKGGLEVALWLAIGTAIRHAVEREQPRVQELIDFLNQRGGELDASTKTALADVIEDLEGARGVIVRYEDNIRQALGISADETFHRLVQGK